jgi:hypothetical protein
VITPVYDPEFLLSNDQVLKTIAKFGISQSSCLTFHLTPTRQDNSSLVVTLTAANPLLGIHNSHRGSLRGIEHVILNPQEPRTTTIQQLEMKSAKEPDEAKAPVDFKRDGGRRY